MKESFDRGILTFLGHHKVASVDKLPPHRKGYVLFLQTMIEQIDQLPVKNTEKEIREQERLKASILTGAMYIISEGMLPASGSLLRDILQETMGVRAENKDKGTTANIIDPMSAAHMTSEAMKFYTALIFPHGSTDKMLAQNPFSKIESMDFVTFEVQGIDLGATARKAVLHNGRHAMINEEKERLRREAESKKGPYASYNPMGWFSGTSKKKDDEEEYDDTLEDTKGAKV